MFRNGTKGKLKYKVHGDIKFLFERDISSVLAPRDGEALQVSVVLDGKHGTFIVYVYFHAFHPPASVFSIDIVNLSSGPFRYENTRARGNWSLLLVRTFLLDGTEKYVRSIRGSLSQRFGKRVNGLTDVEN